MTVASKNRKTYWHSQGASKVGSVMVSLVRVMGEADAESWERESHVLTQTATHSELVSPNIKGHIKTLFFCWIP